MFILLELQEIIVLNKHNTYMLTAQSTLTHIFIIIFLREKIIEEMVAPWEEIRSGEEFL